MVENKKHDPFEEQHDFDIFLDSLDDGVDHLSEPISEDSSQLDDNIKDQLHSIEGQPEQPSMLFSVIRACVAGVVLVSAVIWFIWPDVETQNSITEARNMPVTESSQSMIQQDQDVEQYQVEQDQPNIRVQKNKKPQHAMLAQKKPEVAHIAQNESKAFVSVKKKVVATTPVVKKEVKAAVIVPAPAVVKKQDKIFHVSVDLANIRKTPVSSAEIVLRLKQGTAVKVIRREGDWYQVRLHQEKSAWIFYTLLK